MNERDACEGESGSQGSLMVSISKPTGQRPLGFQGDCGFQPVLTHLRGCFRGLPEGSRISSRALPIVSRSIYVTHALSLSRLPRPLSGISLDRKAG